MRNFFKRALSGIVFVSVLIFCILYSKLCFITLFFILMLFCLYEFKKMIGLKSVFPYIIGILVFVFGNILNVEDLPSIMIFEYVGVALFLTIFMSFASILFALKLKVKLYIEKNIKILTLLYDLLIRCYIVSYGIH